MGYRMWGIPTLCLLGSVGMHSPTPPQSVTVCSASLIGYFPYHSIWGWKGVGGQWDARLWSHNKSSRVYLLPSRPAIPSPKLKSPSFPFEDLSCTVYPHQSPPAKTTTRNGPLQAFPNGTICTANRTLIGKTHPPIARQRCFQLSDIPFLRIETSKRLVWNDVMFVFLRDSL